MSALLDANVLIALIVDDHTHHRAARSWMADRSEPFATCPITEGALLRFLIRGGRSATSAQAVLELLSQHPSHEFWPDTLSYRQLPLGGITGHRQVTDAYLLGLARDRGARLATLDRGLAAVDPEVVELINGS